MTTHLLKLLLLACVFLLSDLHEAGAEIAQIRVVMDNNYPPYAFKDDQGRLQGITVDQWKLWEKKTGIRAELTGMDWADAQRQMASGEFDVIDTIFHNQQREKIYDFSRPYAVIPVPLFFHKDISGISGAEDLGGFMVAAKAGGNVINVLKNNGLTGIIEYPSYEKIIAAARDGRVKVFTVDRPPAMYYLNKMGIQNQFRETKPLYSGEFHRAVTKGNKELLTLMEKGFSAIAPAEYQTIDNKWLGRSLASGASLKDLTPLASVAAIIIISLIVWSITLKRAVAKRTAELHTVLRTIPDLVWIKDCKGVYLGCNHRFERFFGAQEAEIIGKTDYDFVDAGLADFFRENDRLAIAADKPSVNEEWITFAEDGHQELLETVKTPVKDATGKLIGVLGIARDITAQHKATEQLRNQAELLDLTHDAIIVRDLDDRVTFWNRGAAEQYGWSHEEALGKVTHILLQTGFPAPLEEIRETIFRSGCWDGELHHVTRNGTQIVVASRWVLQRDEDGTPMAIMEVNNDITEKLQLEAQMRHSQKLESLGVLAGGIAHDFNNILTAIIGNVELALIRLAPESPALKNLKRIETAAGRAAELATQMLAYSGKGQFVVEPVDLNLLVEEMGHMLEVSISKKVTLTYNLTRPLPYVNADATQIRQIIMNLVINSSEAIGDRTGVIDIITGSMECKVNYLKDAWLTDPIPEGLYVFVEIADNGCGMDSETLARIFDPFFTTKFTGRGLGMAAVLGIVRGHKGAIKISSEPGKGSIFRILFPAGRRPAEEPGSNAGGDPWQGCGTVLLVDDEETVRTIGSEMLQELGFEVVTAGDGREALEIYSSRPDICLIILDLTMPQLDGEQCLRKLREMNPDLRVIISSGFSEYEVSHKFSGKRVNGFIQKPYRLSEMSRTIRMAFSKLR